jgi:hypothetical protein
VAPVSGGFRAFWPDFQPVLVKPYSDKQIFPDKILAGEKRLRTNRDDAKNPVKPDHAAFLQNDIERVLFFLSGAMSSRGLCRGRAASIWVKKSDSLITPPPRIVM